jgi:uncharacterized delta-60 repeat protein
VLSRYLANGSLDTAFGTAGRVTIVADGGGDDTMQALALQSDGKIVVAGFTAPPGASNNSNFVALRYNTDGSVDTGFGSGGKVVTDFNGMRDQASAVMVQSDGKVVVAGFVTLGTPPVGVQDFAVVRYLPNGTPDPAFGVGGKATLNVGGGLDFVSAAALQADGKIVVTGRVSTDGGSGNPDIGVARFLANGSPDLGFGTNGIVRIDFGIGGVAPAGFDGGKLDLPNAVVIQPDGRILIGGRTNESGVDSSALVRLTSRGQLDTSFNNSGLLASSLTGEVKGIALQADGKIVVAGSSNSDFALARYTRDGVADASFNAGGALRIDFFGDRDGAKSVLVQPDGKIVAVGFENNGLSGGGAVIVRALP